MNRRDFIAAIPVAATPAAAVAAAQDAATGDEAAVRSLVQRYVDARESKDPKVIEALLTPDADQLVSDGTWRKGRDSLVKGMLESSTNNPARRTIEVESVRMIAGDVAMAEGRYVQEGRSGAPDRSMWTSITMKKGPDGWRIAALRNMLPAPVQKVVAIPDDADPVVVLDEARQMARQGKYEEALQRHLWFHENALRLRPSMSGVRLSFAISDWVDLGEKYPKAREALVAIRDRDVATLKGGKGSVSLFSDVVSISRYLEEPAIAVELFKLIDAERPKLAERCYLYGEDVLAGAKEYALCSKYIDDPENKLNGEVEIYRMQLEREKTQDARFPRTAARRFTEHTCRLIEILVAADRKPEARSIQSLALKVLDAPKIRGAVAGDDAAPARP